MEVNTNLEVTQENIEKFEEFLEGMFKFVSVELTVSTTVRAVRIHLSCETIISSMDIQKMCEYLAISPNWLFNQSKNELALIF